ncbi:MAG: hypothetical protein ACXVP0_06055 [Bacteroidia bacterium]
MKNIIVTLSLIALGLGYSSCKKTFTCTCSTSPTGSSTTTNTISTGQSTGFVNQIHYSEKSRSSDDALSKCQNQYANSGYVINGYNCTIY